MSADAAPTAAKPGLHARNRHRHGYDFPALLRRVPELQRHLRPTPAGTPSIDFADPTAVLALNRALLLCDYGLEAWDLPSGCLCPPVPGRADYLHHVADLLGDGDAAAIPRGPEVAVLDVGVGANVIYPIVGRRDYGWRFVGTETDPVALEAAQRNVAGNSLLRGHVEVRRQTDPAGCFHGVIGRDERFALTVCNPPFHASAAEAASGTRRKLQNLGRARTARDTKRNFSGRPGELWCPGGEVGFVSRLIAESAACAGQVRWFTSLVSRSESLGPLESELRRVRARDVRILPMAQGQKRSRVLAWTFAALPPRVSAAR